MTEMMCLALNMYLSMLMCALRCASRSWLSFAMDKWRDSENMTWCKRITCSPRILEIPWVKVLEFIKIRKRDKIQKLNTTSKSIERLIQCTFQFPFDITVELDWQSNCKGSLRYSYSISARVHDSLTITIQTRFAHIGRYLACRRALRKLYALQAHTPSSTKRGSGYTVFSHALQDS